MYHNAGAILERLTRLNVVRLKFSLGGRSAKLLPEAQRTDA